MSDMKSDKKKELLTLIEAAKKYNVSTRTIERHAKNSGYAPESLIRNDKKVKGYSVGWLDSVIRHCPTNVGPMSDKLSDNVGQPNDTDIVKILSENITFLRKEIDIKNDQIAKLQESDRNTKMLLADLQIQNKALQAPQEDKAVPIKEPVKKSKKILWWVVFLVLVLGLAITGLLLYNYYYPYL